jgi:hypothetical protein
LLALKWRFRPPFAQKVPLFGKCLKRLHHTLLSTVPRATHGYRYIWR